MATRGEGLPSALVHEAGDHEVVGQPSGEVALEIERARIRYSRHVLRDYREPKDSHSLGAHRVPLVARRNRRVVGNWG